MGEETMLLFNQEFIEDELQLADSGYFIVKGQGFPSSGKVKIRVNIPLSSSANLSGQVTGEIQATKWQQCFIIFD